MNETLTMLIDWNNQPRRIVASGGHVISAGDPTDLLYLLESGQARARDGMRCQTGDLVMVCEALSLAHYTTPVLAETECQIIILPQQMLEESLASGGAMVWPLSRSIAAEVTQRRLAS